METCGNCERKIGKLESACVFNGIVVCSGCDELLRAAARKTTRVKNLLEDTPSSALRRQKRDWGAVVTYSFVILFLLGFFVFGISKSMHWMSGKTYGGKSESEWVSLSQDKSSITRAAAYEALYGLRREDILREAMDEQYNPEAERAAIYFYRLNPTENSAAVRDFINKDVEDVSSYGGLMSRDLESLLLEMKKDAIPVIPELQKLSSHAVADYEKKHIQEVIDQINS